MFSKALKKLGHIFNGIRIRYKLYSWRILSEGRFIFQSPYFIGKSLSLNTDLTETVINVAKGFRVRNHFNVTIGNNGELQIGENCFFNNNCSINCLGKVEIGSDNQFGENVSIYDHNHRYKDNNELISSQGYNIGKIKIGNNCWIGSHVVILKDVIIGDNVVIGAGCVIYESVISNSVVINKQNHLIQIREG